MPIKKPAQLGPLHRLLLELHADPDVVEAMPLEAVRAELRRRGLDPEALMAQVKKQLDDQPARDNGATRPGGTGVILPFLAGWWAGLTWFGHRLCQRPAAAALAPLLVGAVLAGRSVVEPRAEPAPAVHSNLLPDPERRPESSPSLTKSPGEDSVVVGLEVVIEGGSPRRREQAFVGVVSLAPVRSAGAGIGPFFGQQANMVVVAGSAGSSAAQLPAGSVGLHPKEGTPAKAAPPPGIVLATAAYIVACSVEPVGEAGSGSRPLTASKLPPSRLDQTLSSEPLQLATAVAAAAGTIPEPALGAPKPPPSPGLLAQGPTWSSGFTAARSGTPAARTSPPLGQWGLAPTEAWRVSTDSLTPRAPDRRLALLTGQ